MGWVALVGPEIEENLGLRYISASLRAAGFCTEILPFNSGCDLPQILAVVEGATSAPLMVAVSMAFQWRAEDAMALIVALRERGYAGHLTVGGHFGTFVHRELLRDFPELDSVCCFESEESMVRLAEAVRAQGRTLVQPLLGIANRAESGAVVFPGARAAPELEHLAWPDRRGEAATCLGHRIAAMVMSRGCYANCAFCCIAAWHQAQCPGQRFRLRPVADVADEMVWLRRDLNREIFIFHDDNFFVPDKRESLARIHGLADALAARGMGSFATIVKARPTDVTAEVFEVMRQRLQCIRVFLGVENDAAQGLKTLNRRVSRRRNHEAMQILRELGIYVCYNMLVFDPDATFGSLRTNLEFIVEHGHYPSNFGRVELYAGTPLLARMQAEGRATGTYFRWNYSLASRGMDRVFDMAMSCFYERNFSGRALANRLQSTRFDAEVCRRFHPRVYRDEWRQRAESLSRALAEDSARGLYEIIELVEKSGSEADGRDLVSSLSQRLRDTENRLALEATSLEREIQTAVRAFCHHGRPRVATLTSLRGDKQGCASSSLTSTVTPESA